MTTSAESIPDAGTVIGGGGVQQLQTPQTPILTVACRILRSPSHESVTTDLSLFSVSTMASELHGCRRLLGFKGDFVRGHSPNPEHRQNSNRPADIPEILWFEEENDLIRSCAALSSAVGLQKSFSTSDISQLPSPDETDPRGNSSNIGFLSSVNNNLKAAISELALNSIQRSGYLLDHARLDHTSRSCSTWVAVGDVVSTSQLPSPHGGASCTTVGAPTVTQSTTVQTPTPTPPTFTAADFIRSVNKKVRQNYIRRRLLTTYKALERLSQSEFNLDRIEVTPSTAAASVTTECTSASNRLSVPGCLSGAISPTPSSSRNSPISSANAAVLRVVKQRGNQNLPLTLRDVERERGKPLSKYERNMMIFNWLHTLDENAVVEGVP